MSIDVSNDGKLIQFDKHVEALLGILKAVITWRIKYFAYNKRFINNGDILYYRWSSRERK